MQTILLPTTRWQSTLLLHVGEFPDIEGNVTEEVRMKRMEFYEYILSQEEIQIVS